MNPVETGTIPEPVGYRNIDLVDQQHGLVYMAFENMLMMADVAGVRHAEVKRLSNAYYNCICIGFKKNLHMDDLIMLMFDSNNNTPRVGVVEASISPIHVSRLEDFSKEMGDSPMLPGLVVQVASKEFLIKSSTQTLDNQVLDLNGAAELLSHIFPVLLECKGQPKTAQERLTSSGRSVARLSSGFENVRVKSIECTIEAGSMSPRKKPLPTVTVQLLSPEDIQSISGNDWKPPIPLSDANITPPVRAQLDNMFRYLYVIHAPKDLAVSARDLPKELVLEHDPSNPLLWRCIALGYNSKICLADMLRLYLSDTARIKDIYYDFTRKARKEGVMPGALVVEFLVDPSGSESLLSSRMPSLLDNNRTSLVRVRRAEVPQVQSPSSSVPVSPPPPARFMAPFSMVEARKRKSEEPTFMTVVTSPPPPSPTLSVVNSEVPDQDLSAVTIAMTPPVKAPFSIEDVLTEGLSPSLKQDSPQVLKKARVDQMQSDAISTAKESDSLPSSVNVAAPTPMETIPSENKKDEGFMRKLAFWRRH